MTIVHSCTFLISVTSALSCSVCNGTGTSCIDQGKRQTCPPNGVGHCGRATFMQNGVQKVLEMCTLAKFCVGNIDCLEDGYEVGKPFKNATDCVVSCCEGDNCDPPVPLKCHRCQGKGDINLI